MDDTSDGQNTMTIETLKRVMWRLRKNNPNTLKPTNNELARACVFEVGHDWRTYQRARKALITLGWIKSYGNKRVRLTGKDMTDS